MFLIHAAAHASILTEAGARGAMVLDVVVLLIGSLLGLLNVGARYRLGTRPNFQHCSNAPAHTEPVPFSCTGHRFRFTSETGTRVLDKSHFRIRLRLSSATAVRPPRLHKPSQLSGALQALFRAVHVSTRSASRSAKNTGRRLRSPHTCGPLKNTLVPIHTTRPPIAVSPLRKRRASHFYSSPPAIQIGVSTLRDDGTITVPFFILIDERRPNYAKGYSSDGHKGSLTI